MVMNEDSEDQEVFCCAGCGYQSAYGDLPEAKDITLRHCVGDVFSDVECPECGALCFPLEEPGPEEEALDALLQCVKFLTNPHIQDWLNRSGAFTDDYGRVVLNGIDALKSNGIQIHHGNVHGPEGQIEDQAGVPYGH